MAKTEAEFLAAFAEHQTAYNALINAVNGKSGLMQTTKGGIDVVVENYRQIVLRAEALLASGGTGGTGGGGTTTPSTTLALIKSAISAAPQNYASIPTENTITVIQGAPNELPVYPGGAIPVLHYFDPPSGNAAFKGPSGSPDILTVTKAAAPETFSFAYGGDSRWSQSNGANVLARMWAQEIGAHVVGFTVNGRYFSYMGRFQGTNATITINGMLQPAITVTSDDTWTTIDMGSRATRNIVFNGGQNEFGGIAIPTGDTIVPFDHMAGKFRYNALHDSWGQQRDYEKFNLRLPDIYAKLIGAHSVGGYVRGGTGYLQGVDITTSQGLADDNQRKIDLNAGAPHMVDLRMMVNDPDPSGNADLQPAVRRVFERTRTDNPTALFAVGAWTSQGSRSTVTGGETRKRDLYKAEWDRITGPKVFIDGLAGTWYIDAGTGAGVKTRATTLGPIITGEGSAASPTGTGNADLYIDNNGGRHPTSKGVVYIDDWFAARLREALAVV